MPHSLSSASVGPQGRNGISKPCTDTLPHAFATNGQYLALQENTVTCNETGLTSVGHVARSSSEACATCSNCHGSTKLTEATA
mmetsp:Transcript_77543/g.122250  ORF Transcript_77543/g.122250 Transcript_77543/m.122250 type:complete len:83 (-) Transcript_77543:892-1140(-)